MRRDLGRLKFLFRAQSSTKPTIQAANKKKRTKANGGNSANGSVATLTKVTKAAKSVGGAQAKRAATTANRRGLSATAAPTKAAIKQQVGKAAAKQAKQNQNQAQNGRKNGRGAAQNNNSRPNSAPAAVPSLKISFRPDELKKTTEKSVSAQVSVWFLFSCCRLTVCFYFVDWWPRVSHSPPFPLTLQIRAVLGKTASGNNNTNNNNNNTSRSNNSSGVSVFHKQHA